MATGEEEEEKGLIREDEQVVDLVVGEIDKDEMGDWEDAILLLVVDDDDGSTTCLAVFAPPSFFGLLPVPLVIGTDGGE